MDFEDNERDPLLPGDLRQETTVAIDSNINQQTEKSRTRIFYYRNILCLSFAHTCIYVVFMSIQNIQSTANEKQGLGVYSLATVFVAVFLTCIIAPLVVRYTGYKWAVVIGFIGQLIYTASNIYPTMYTLIPSSFILGAVSSVAWTGQGTYVTKLAKDYATLTGQNMGSVISQFNGIFYFFFQNGQIWGNMVSSLILASGNNVSHNATQTCGYDFCNSNYGGEGNQTSTSTIPDSVMYLLIGVFLGFDVVGILITSCCVTNMEQSDNDVLPWKNSALYTLKLHGNKYLILLLVLFTYIGYEQAFLFGEYTQAFPGCSLGVGNIGYVMITFGITDSLSSFAMGQIEKWTGRILLFTVAMLLNISMLVTLIFWNPTEDGHEVVFYIIPAIWGISDAIWQTTTSAFIGVLFCGEQEPAFASYRMWQALGFAICFGMSQHLCMDLKIYITIAFVTTAAILYYVVEWIQRHNTVQIMTVVVNK